MQVIVVTMSHWAGNIRRGFKLEESAIAASTTPLQNKTWRNAKREIEAYLEVESTSLWSYGDR